MHILELVTFVLATIQSVIYSDIGKKLFLSSQPLVIGAQGSSTPVNKSSSTIIDRIYASEPILLLDAPKPVLLIDGPKHVVSLAVISGTAPSKNEASSVYLQTDREIAYLQSNITALQVSLSQCTYHEEELAFHVEQLEADLREHHRTEQHSTSRSIQMEREIVALRMRVKVSEAKLWAFDILQNDAKRLAKANHVHAFVTRATSLFAGLFLGMLFLYSLRPESLSATIEKANGLQSHLAHHQDLLAARDALISQLQTANSTLTAENATLAEFKRTHSAPRVSGLHIYAPRSPPKKQDWSAKLATLMEQAYESVGTSTDDLPSATTALQQHMATCESLSASVTRTIDQVLRVAAEPSETARTDLNVLDSTVSSLFCSVSEELAAVEGLKINALWSSTPDADTLLRTACVDRLRSLQSQLSMLSTDLKLIATSLCQQQDVIATYQDTLAQQQHDLTIERQSICDLLASLTIFESNEAIYQAHFAQQNACIVQLSSDLAQQHQLCEDSAQVSSSLVLAAVELRADLISAAKNATEADLAYDLLQDRLEGAMSRAVEIGSELAKAASELEEAESQREQLSAELDFVRKFGADKVQKLESALNASRKEERKLDTNIQLIKVTVETLRKELKISRDISLRQSDDAKAQEQKLCDTETARIELAASLTSRESDICALRKTIEQQQSASDANRMALDLTQADLEALQEANEGLLADKKVLEENARQLTLRLNMQKLLLRTLGSQSRSR